MTNKLQIVPPPSRERLWVRLGDASNYENVLWEDLPSVLNYKNAGAFVDWLYAVDGLVTSEYTGRNYISLFWGDQNAQLLRSLDEEERDQVEDMLKPFIDI